MNRFNSVPPDLPSGRPDSCPYDPDEAYARLRAEEPVSLVRCPAGMDAWLVSRYDDIREVLADTRLSSRGAGNAHVLSYYDAQDPVPGWMFQLDGEEHTRLRRLLIGEFTGRRMEALRPRVQEITDTHIDAMLAGQGADLVRDLASPIPSLVTCEILGVPEEHHKAIQYDSEALSSFETDKESCDAALRRMKDCLHEVIGRRLTDPQDDLLSRLIARGERTERPLTAEELANIGVMLLISGHETTTHMIALGMLVLLEHPDQLAALRAAPDTVDTAVEELLRHLSVIQFGAARYATEDVTVGGTAVKAGEWLVAAIPSGNRDERAFDAPDTVDLGRRARTHLSFGYGPHQCIGAQLARIELRIVLSTLLRRMPGLRLAKPLTRSEFRTAEAVYGLRSMPVLW